MGNAKFSDGFKRDAVFQITERGYPVAEVAARLGISKYSLYEWRKLYAQPATARDAVARRVRTAAQNASRGRLENSGRFTIELEEEQFAH